MSGVERTSPKPLNQILPNLTSRRHIVPHHLVELLIWTGTQATLSMSLGILLFHSPPYKPCRRVKYVSVSRCSKLWVLANRTSTAHMVIPLLLDLHWDKGKQIWPPGGVTSSCQWPAGGTCVRLYTKNTKKDLPNSRREKKRFSHFQNRIFWDWSRNLTGSSNRKNNYYTKGLCE